MAEFKVTTSDLRAKATKLEELNGRFKSAVTALVNSEIKLNAMWDGEANDEFHTAFETDKAKMEKIYNLTQKYIDALKQIAQNYDTVERKNICTAKKRSY
ncbi:MAG: WXG100 family type VII secretion target [Ruminococcus sp.]|nr:WXG100 family type VII secretion target [Ruminococcus sp.]